MRHNTNVFVTQFFSELTKSNQTSVEGAGISLSIGPQMVIGINSRIVVVTPYNGNRIPTHFGPGDEFDGIDMSGCLPHFPTMSSPASRTGAFFT